MYQERQQPSIYLTRIFNYLAQVHVEVYILGWESTVADELFEYIPVMLDGLLQPWKQKYLD